MTHAPTPSRRTFLATVAATALAGCNGPTATQPTTDGDGATTSTGTTQTTATTGDAPPVADATLPLPMAPDVLREHVGSGGPPKDGIPSVDTPSFEPADAVGSRLDPGSIVFGVERNGVAKAYPQYILVWHEVVNDDVGGDPVSVTYCPLTGTALGFERGDTTFGVSGRLVNNNLIMYDRGTEQWWPQVLSTTLPSPWHEPYERRSLQDFRVVWTTWERWRTLHPDTLVLTEATGNLRNYGNDPYGSYADGERFGYYADGRSPMFPSLSDSDRYEPKQVVIGARTTDGTVAFLKDALREHRILAGSLAGAPVLGVYDPRLDTAYVYRNPGEATVTADGDEYVTGGSSYTADDLPLEHVHAFDAMWFAWNGFYPESGVYD